MSTFTLNPMRRFAWLAVAAIVASVWMFEVTLNGSFLGSDDAYIHLRYIDHVRRGLGFGFNPGLPAFGDTSPLWVYLAAFANPATADLSVDVRNLSLLLFAASILLFCLIARRLLNSDTLAVIATALYASDAWMLKWAGSAMEASLAALTVLAATLAFLEARRRHELFVSSALMAAAVLVRPELGLLFALFLLLVVTDDHDWRETSLRVALCVCGFAAILVPWLVHAYRTFGTVVPFTFTAKTVGSTTSYWTVGWYFARIAGLSYWWTLPLGAVAAVQAWRHGWWDVKALRGSREQRALLALCAWCVAIPVYYTVSRLQTPSTRYLQIVIPVLFLVGFTGFIRLMDAMGARHLRTALVGLATAAVVGSNVIVNALVVVPSSRDFTAGLLEGYRQVGQWLKDHTSADQRVAVAIDVGAIGYFSERQIIDLGGLNTYEAIAYLPDSLRYVLVARPEYLVVTGEPEPGALAQQARFHDIVQQRFSVPADLGMRASLDATTGGGQRASHHVTVYELRWPPARSGE